MTEIKMGKTC